LLTGIVLACLWALVLVLAMAESALSYASQAKLEERIEDARRRRQYVRYLDRSVSARFFCTGLRVLTVSALIAILALRGEGGRSVLWVQAGCGAVAAAVAEVLGRLVGKRLSTGVLLVLLPLLQVSWYLAWPLRAIRGEEAEAGPPERDEQVVDAAMEEIRVAIRDATTEGAIHADEKDMIEGVLEFEDVQVHELMSPRTEIECVEADTPIREALEVLAEFHHTRIPVFEEVRDRVVGVLHVKDLLPVMTHPEEQQPDLRDLMRKPFFVPETKRAVSLLRDFQQRHLQIAVILDEYGGVTGLVTLEDVMEQIVGELDEGFEAENIEDRIRTLGGGALDVDARLHVDEVNDLMGGDLPEDEDYDTIGGFLMAQFASVPQKDQELRHDGLLLRVLESNSRRVHRVLLRRLEPDEVDTEDAGQ
jgi:magnesium and cobalt transporter